MLKKTTLPPILIALLSIACGRTVVSGLGDDSGVMRPDSSTPPTFDGRPPPPISDGAAPPPLFDGPSPLVDGWVPPPPPQDAGPRPPRDGGPPPPLSPDLVAVSLQATVAGGNNTRVRYELQVCNRGNGSSPATTAAIYYNRAIAPGLGQSADATLAFPQLAPGSCTTRRATWWGVPAGTYTSWALVDPNNAIWELDERNNAAGPITVVVGGSSDPLPDLAFSTFDATVSGDTVTYRAEICNRGQATARQTRIDFYYQSFLPPAATTGSDGATVFGPLGAGACTVVTRQRTGTPDGTYLSWARLDRLGSVIESDESNNLSPPVRVTVGPPPQLSCTAICGAALVCSVFPPLQFSECLNWCTPLDETSKDCLSDAARTNDCAALRGCAPLPPPPPPPPPGTCDPLCQWFVTSCNVLPIDLNTCQSICEGLTPAGIACAQNAAAQNNCQAALSCIF